MKKIWLLLLIIQGMNAQDIASYLFDYNPLVNITNMEKAHKRIIGLPLTDEPIIPDYIDKKYLEITTKYFDLNSVKAVKKITLYQYYITPKKEKIYEIGFFENGKIKYFTDFTGHNSNQTFEYLENLEVRKEIYKEFVNTIDSLFYNNNKLAKFSHHSKSSNGDVFTSECINYAYDEFNNLILKYSLKSSAWAKNKISYDRHISKYFYYKDSIVEKRYQKGNIPISIYDKNILSDTINTMSYFKQTWTLNAKKRIDKIEIRNNGSSKVFSGKYFDYDTDNRIISLKNEDDELRYKYEYNKNGKIEKAFDVADELTDIYKYNKNGDLIQANTDLYYYVYDQFGNWVDYKIHLKRADYNKHSIREIEYY